MLSNKLTFSLVLVLMLVAALCLPMVADAQDVALTPPDAVNADADAGIEAIAVGVIPAGSFVVYHNTTTDPPGVVIADVRLVENTGFPELENFFARDWMIEVVAPISLNLDPKELVISEIMWGLDMGPAANGSESGEQWIELYNASGRDLTIAADQIVLLFTQFPQKLPTNYLNVTAAADGIVIGDIRTAADGDRLNTLGATADDKKKAITADDTHTHVVVDRVTNVTFDTLGVTGRYPFPGQSGRTELQEAATQQSFPQEPLISANRTINYAAAKASDGVPAGHEEASWEATNAFARRNTANALIVANPGMGVNPTVYVRAAKTPDPKADQIVINEIYNGSDGNDLDWIEIKNIMEPGSTDSDINIENWEIAKVDGEKTVNIVDLPKYILGAQEILLIVSRDPGETILAGGVDISILADPNQDQLNKGAQHRYYIQDGLDVPGNAMLLVLRDNHEKNAANEYHNNIQDAAGGLEVAGYTKDRTGATLVFPFKSYLSLGDDKAADVGKVGSAWARKPKGIKAGYYTIDNVNGRHKGAWESVTGATTMGLGYDRDVDLGIAHGTPGYENMIANTVDDYVSTDPDPDGMEIAADLISISEIMYDAGPRWNQVQWIELYNASMTQAVNVAGWELEIRNATDAVESYVDSSFIFDDAVILPNQTLLVVSGPGQTDVPENRVYNLFRNHRRELGLTNRRSVLLSPDGFYLKLTDKADITRDHRTDQDVIVDEAGNVAVDGAKRTVAWELPARDPEVRQSLVRQYGTRKIDGASDAADIGTLDTAWVASDITGAGLSYFGHRNDVGTPGYRLGGPLPVSLASFRPVRDKATGEVVIRWITQSELNNAGFNILRADSKDGEFQVVNLTGIIAGHGTTSEKHVYSYVDKTAKPNVAYYYQIEDVSLNGHRTTLQTTHMRGNVNASGKLTTTWSDLKLQK